MKSSALTRCALGVCATAMLAGCGGGGGTPLSPSFAQLTAHRTQTTVTYGLLRSFGGSGDGTHPVAGLLNVKGTLYGTTTIGGANNAGTVFAMTTSGTETVLHISFTGGSDGAIPLASLIDVNGTFYGTTFSGGGSGDGTVFKITPSGAYAVLYRFSGYPTDGANPRIGALMNVKDAGLYGTTSKGGASNVGTVFRITKSGAETVLYSFTGGSDGREPLAGLVDAKGTLYGTTFSGGTGGCTDGCGTTFKISRLAPALRPVFSIPL